MCIIIVNKDNVLPEETLVNSWDSNIHGGGLAWAEGGQVHAFKTMVQKEMFDEYHRIKDSGIKNVILHFRIKTHGSISIKNCHPFPVHDNMMMMHNGVIDHKYYYEEIGHENMTDKEWNALDYSDTALFARYLTYNFPKNLIFNTKALGIIRKLIGTRNKLAFIDKSGNTAIVNQGEGVTDGENWYSNSSYKTKKVTYTNHNYSNYVASACEYCGAKGVLSKYGGWTYCTKHYNMAVNGKKDHCDICEVDISGAFTYYQGLDLCLTCRRTAPEASKCENCLQWTKCVMVEGVRLCIKCEKGEPEEKKTTEKEKSTEDGIGERAVCKACDVARDGCKKWNGVWLCSECLRLALKTKNTVYGEKECCNCLKKKMMSFRRVKHKFICINCVNGEDDEPRDICKHCKQLSSYFEGYLCSECGLDKRKDINESDKAWEEEYIKAMEETYGLS